MQTIGRILLVGTLLVAGCGTAVEPPRKVTPAPSKREPATEVAPAPSRTPPPAKRQ